MLKKDIKWSIAGVDYVIRNVPYGEIDADGEEFVDLDTAIKLEMIRILMHKNDILRDIDYNLVADFEI